MMTPEHIKEAISVRYIELIASYNGYSTSSAQKDYGTDLDIREVDVRTEGNRQRYSETGRELKLQIKATTEKGIKVSPNGISYELNAVTFNDLVARKRAKSPLLLILFVLPDDADQWLTVSDEELICRKCAYWYFPKEDIPTDNTHSISIEIPRTNLISSETLNWLFLDFA